MTPRGTGSGQERPLETPSGPAPRPRFHSPKWILMRFQHISRHPSPLVALPESIINTYQVGWQGTAGVGGVV